MPSLQKSIRDLERLQKRRGSSVEIDQRISNLQEEWQKNQKKEKERKLSVKYHMVKFVERQKLVRQIRKILSQLNDVNNTANYDELESKKQKLMDKLCYVLYYPKDMKYIALFPKNSNGKGEDSGISGGDIPTKKVLLKQNQAREIARENRENDINEGNEDRVQHAIDIALNRRPNGVWNEAMNSVKNTTNESFVAEDSNYRRLTVTSHKIKSKMSVNRTSGEGLDGIADQLNEYSIGDSIAIVGSSCTSSSSGKKNRERDFRSSSVTGSEAHLDMDRSTDNDLIIDVAPQAKKTKPDPFFIEESNEDVMQLEKSNVKPPQVKVAIGDLKNFKSKKNGRKIVAENDGTLTKQELRLLNWQLNVRGRKNI